MLIFSPGREQRVSSEGMGAAGPISCLEKPGCPIPGVYQSSQPWGKNVTIIGRACGRF